MASTASRTLSPRKKPRQARATFTLDAIFEATIQLLVADGMHRLTTTKVAERAGVSVGTLYQYFPHKEALVYAVNERYLENLAARIESTCRAQHGRPIGEMVEALIDTYWRAKTERADVTRALYRSVAELDNQALIDAFAKRADAATSAMLASATDATFTDLKSVNLTLVTVIFGAVRNAFERNLRPAETRKLRRQLVTMCQAYLESAA
ncbi:MAG: TetR/AcrR family transcriptional regulator [Hydrogenophaga sp.]|uniref:TetR/AcrR family transcriptional regulator n=1 Tax=Hydrogenophaga sp. TaxID=1904254 RepID=UPI002716BCF3|nr:TetR/AcrR family transcriptional regulator [Hydrogenophaga sp.]MDO9570472.1 TetR/AcrR family transcriptional regulator [Hydrogenophaga sp.]